MRIAHIAYGHSPEAGSAFVADGSDIAVIILDLRPGDLTRLAALATERDLAIDLLTAAHPDLIDGHWHPDLGLTIDLGHGHSLSLGLTHTAEDTAPDSLISIDLARQALSTSLSAGVTDLLARLERGTDQTGNRL